MRDVYKLGLSENPGESRYGVCIFTVCHQKRSLLSAARKKAKDTSVKKYESFGKIEKGKSFLNGHRFRCWPNVMAIKLDSWNNV